MDTTSYGADANAVRRNGWTPLHMAADRFTDCPEDLIAVSGPKDCYRMCEILLFNDAKVTAVTEDGMQPLHLVCSQGHSETAKLLLSHGADVNAVSKQGLTSLHLSADGTVDCPELCELLLNFGAKIDAVSGDGMQPLHLGCLKYLKETVKVLLSHSADINAVNERQLSPLHLVAYGAVDCPEVLMRLLPMGHNHCIWCAAKATRKLRNYYYLMELMQML
jgi:ankyrin repeat protein